MKTKEKVCRGCNRTLPYPAFVNSTGEQTNSGRYCQPCNSERQESEKQARIREREDHIEKYRIVYGEYWHHYASPLEFYDVLYEERDSCPYCGITFEDAQGCKLNGSTMHIDHMDPLFKGGEDSIRNAVYCCSSCNYKKGRLSFVNWLNKLEPEFQIFARQIYIDKHGHTPEDFVEGLIWDRHGDSELLFYRSLGDVKSSYPTPIVNGPPTATGNLKEIRRILKEHRKKK